MYFVFWPGQNVRCWTFLQIWYPAGRVILYFYGPHIFTKFLKSEPVDLYSNSEIEPAISHCIHRRLFSVSYPNLCLDLTTNLPSRFQLQICPHLLKLEIWLAYDRLASDKKKMLVHKLICLLHTHKVVLDIVCPRMRPLLFRFIHSYISPESSLPYPFQFAILCHPLDVLLSYQPTNKQPSSSQNSMDQGSSWKPTNIS